MTRHDTTQETSLAGRVVQGGSTAIGTALSTTIRTMAALRPAAKPLHPEGVVLTGSLERRGSAVPSGSAWVDEPGRDEVVVRLSRAIGLPDAMPDIHGLAVRVPTPAGEGDLLFASTGWNRLGRFVLTFGGGPESRPLTTLLPYRTASGPVLLGVRASGPQVYEMSWCRPRGEWRSFAELRVSGEEAPHQAIAFDPVRNQLPGLTQYAWVTRLREPSYRTARRSRRK
jgi:hypothetical protein